MENVKQGEEKKKEEKAQVDTGTESKLGKIIRVILGIFLLFIKTTDIVSGGVWGRRPHTFSEPTSLAS